MARPGPLETARLPGPSRRIYLVGGRVYEASGDGQGPPPRPVSTTREYIWALLRPPLAARASRDGIVGEARSYAERVEDLSFAVTELRPTLAALGGSEPPGESETAELAGLVADLRGRAEVFLRRLREVHFGRHLETRLARLIGGPSALLGQAIVPLQPLASDDPADLTVTILRQRYRYMFEHTRSFEGFLDVVRRAAQLQLQHATTRDVALVRTAAALMRKVNAILARLTHESRASCQVVYRDAYHELQHGRGRWLLVRRSLASRLDGRTLCAGLLIRGDTRRKRLAVPPQTARTEDELWNAAGQPFAGAGLCMGSANQYRKLLSEQFTDSEALIQWLDAAVILATGKSDLHRAWRAKRGRGSALSPLRLARRCGRR